jgi:chromosome segregation ATPase
LQRAGEILFRKTRELEEENEKNRQELRSQKKKIEELKDTLMNTDIERRKVQRKYDQLKEEYHGGRRR